MWVSDMTGIRTGLGVTIGLVAALEGGTGAASAHQLPPDEAQRLQPSTMATFIALLRRDEGLRARFSHDPHAVMREHGIDSAPFNLHRLDTAGRQRLLIELAQQADPKKPGGDTAPKPSTGTDSPKTVPVPPYGPPPKPSTDADKPPPRNTPAPVYGPPPKPR